MTSESDASPSLKDPVCGMTVTPASPHTLVHEGRPVYFCAAGCKIRFAADPGRYSAAAVPLSSAPAAIDEAVAGATYTCPMHPEVRQDQPGACPKCGMALEPDMPTLGEAASPELTDFTRRLFWTLPFTFVVFVLAMTGHRFQWFSAHIIPWAETQLRL